MLRLKSLLGVVLAASALGVITRNASAQQVYKGTFSLSAETFVQDSVLQPGDYTITIGHVAPAGIDVVRIEGVGGSASVLATASEPAAFSEHGRLFFVDIGGKHVLKQFHAGLIGKSFNFATPKGLKATARDGGQGTPAVVTVQ